MKNIIISSILCSCFLFFNCSRKTNDESLGAVNLVFPSNNLLCIDNNVNFDWSEATNSENSDVEYNLIIAKDRGLTDVVENRTIAATELSINLEKGVAFYWKVDVIESNTNQVVSSSTFAFYTKGEGVVNYAPFVAEIISPTNNEVVAAGSAVLSWDAADTDAGDTLTYEVLFGENSTLNLIEDDLTEKSTVVSVEAGKTYSWQVNVKDQNGAKSIGQIFTFSVN